MDLNRCCGINSRGSRCKIHTHLTSESYGIDFHICRFHTSQNVVLEWSKKIDHDEIPREVNSYLKTFYSLCKGIDFMRDVPIVMLTSFIIKNKVHGDCYTVRDTFYENIFKETTTKTDDCPVCFEESQIITKCGHPFCRECIYTWCDKRGTCPMCRSQFFKIF